ncbi:MAG: hypothetical protein J0L72_10390 [Armatimonadetes bacterium]|nr:hypothetical protein [Armatimonadota bacterium]
MAQSQLPLENVSTKNGGHSGILSECAALLQAVCIYLVGNPRLQGFGNIAIASAAITSVIVILWQIRNSRTDSLITFASAVFVASAILVRDKIPFDQLLAVVLVYVALISALVYFANKARSSPSRCSILVIIATIASMVR